MTAMDHKQAASLIEKWIPYYEMDEPEAWEKDEYVSVKSACTSMQLAIQALRGKSAAGGIPFKEAARQLEQFLEEHYLDDPDEWEKENLAFVEQVLEALRYAIKFLQK